MATILAVFLASIGLLCVTGLVGFLAISAAFYLTHRPLAVERDEEPGRKSFFTKFTPPPVAPKAEEVVVHPEVEDWIKLDSEPWAQSSWREKAVQLYQENRNWPWVLAKLRTLAGEVPTEVSVGDSVE